MNVERRNRYAYGTKPNKTIDMHLDLHTLDIICSAIITDNESLRRGQLINIRNLIYLINPQTYENDAEKLNRIKFIKKGIEARLDNNITDPYMILTYINGGIIDTDSIDLNMFPELSRAELNWLNNMVSEALKYSHVYNNSDKLIDICTRLKSKDYSSKAELVSQFEKTINDIQNDFRRAKNEDQTESMFSLQENLFEDIMYDTHRTLSSPRRRLVTGMQGMNELLGGGYENGRCYVYFGLPGEGKSTIILNIIYQLKKYNRDYKTKDPTKRPCILLLTMENTVTESVERLFGMATGRDSMVNYTPDNVIKMLREEGELYLNDNSPIDIIIKFKPSNSVDTSYLYTLTEDLEDQGLEVIAVFQDYIGRIRSTERLQDTRLEYGMIVDEFKTFAEIKDIPVISVAQLNRDASKHIDEGRKASKSDLVRLIGRSNISESMLILNNIDAGFLIAPELTASGERFLGVQRIKIRYNAGNREFVYLPFAKNTLKLIEDYGKTPNFKTTMRDNVSPDYNSRSMYKTNVITDMGQVIPTSPDDNNIFSTKVYTSDIDISDLEANMRIESNFITPIIF